MFTKRIAILAAAALVTAAGCYSRNEPTTSLRGLGNVVSEAETVAAPAVIDLRSEAVRENGTIPSRFTCDGRNVSPPLNWSAVPEGTAALALIVDDPDAPRGTFAHWVVFNLPPDLNGLSEAVEPGSALGSVAGAGASEPVQGTNGFNNVGYDGPCPPEGSTHRYVFHLYALDQPLNFDSSATREQMLEAIEGHVLGEGRLTVSYSRSQAG